MTEPKRLTALSVLAAASLLLGCAGHRAPRGVSTAPQLEGIVSLHVFKVETANRSPAAEALSAEVQRWIEAVGRGRGCWAPAWQVDFECVVED